MWDGGELLSEEEARAVPSGGDDAIPKDWKFIAGTLTDYSSYEASTLQYWEHDGKIYEYSDSHCSCNGFEWHPEEVTREYVKNMTENKASHEGLKAKLLEWLS